MFLLWTKREILVAVSIVVFAALGTGACVAQEIPYLEKLPYVPSKAEQYRGTKITVITAAGLMDAFTITAKAFEKQTGIKVEFLQYPHSTLHDKLVVDLSAGTSQYDVVDFDDMWAEEVRPWVEPLDKYLSDRELVDPDYDIYDAVPGSWVEFRYPHSPKGTPFALVDMNVTMLPAYNWKILKDAGLDPAAAVDTWENYYQAAKKVTKDTDGDGKIDFFGSPVAGQLHCPLVFWGYSIYGAWGGRLLFDQDWYPTWYSPNGWLSLEHFLKLAKETSPPASINWSWSELVQSLKQGKSAFMYTWTDGWADMNDPTKSRVAGQIAFAVPPKGPVGRSCRQGAWGLGIPLNAKNKEAAFIYMQWATSKEMQLPLAALGYIGAPWRMSAFENPKLYEIHDYFKVIKESSLNYATHLPYMPEWWEICLTLAENMRGAWLGEFDAKEAMRRAAETAEDILREAGYYGY